MSKFKRFRDLPILVKISSIMLWGALSVVTYLVLFQEIITNKSYEELEERYSRNMLNRIEKLINREMDQLDLTLQDWAHWDDSYRFVSGGDTEYEESNLTEETFLGNKINIIAFYSLENKRIWGRSYDLEKKRFKAVKILDDRSINSLLPLGDSSFQKEKGILIVEEDLFFVALQGILYSNKTGPPAGYMLMARKLTPHVIDDLQRLSDINFHIHSIDHLETNHPLVGGKEISLVQIVGEESHSYKTMDSVHKKNGILLETINDREISRHGKQQVNSIRNAIFFIIFLFMFLVILLLEWTISRPLRKITHFIKSLNGKGSIEGKIDMDQLDEVGFLASSLDHFLEKSSDQKSELIRLNVELREQASTDALTGLFNRHVMDARVPHLWQTLSRGKGWLSVLMIDIDFFKHYNDSYGHQQGDVCIASIASIIMGQLKRVTDLAIRYGGEEFLIVLPSTDLKGALHVAGKIRKAIIDERIEHRASTIEKFVTVSMGVTGEIPSSRSSLAGMIERCDEALYLSKEEGRNRISLLKEGP